MTDSSWDMVETGSANDAGSADGIESLEAFFVSHGLAKHSISIVEATDAESCDDLALLSASAVEAIITKLDLKPVAAEKFRRAVGAVRGEPASPATQHSPDAAAAKTEASSNSATRTEAKCEPAAAAPSLDECVVVCLDRSGSMGTPFLEEQVSVFGSSTGAEAAKAVQQRTRMEAVKVMFYAFRDRVDGLPNRGGTRLGLVQFDNHVEKLLDLTAELSKFESIVDDVERRGQTAIFSAIVAACASLESVAAASPETDLRVLVLSDGQNNAGCDAREALAAAHSVGATVDAIIVGDSPDAALRKIVTATGGECFQIRSLGEGFELLESEGVASLKARRGGAPKPPRPAQMPTIDLDAFEQKAMCRSAPAAPRPAAAASVAGQKVQSLAAWSGPAGATVGAASGMVAKRIAKELHQAAAGDPAVWMHTGEGVHIYPSESDVRCWRALIEGPAASPFAGGVFSLTVSVPDDYPLKPPTILFETPVYHCNVSDGGAICLDILKEKWSPALTIPKCLEAVRLMLANPDSDNALRQWIAELTLAHARSAGQDTRYVDNARERTAKDAAPSVAEAVKRWSA